MAPRQCVVDINQPATLRGQWLNDFAEDAIRVSSHRVSVMHNTVIDSVGGLAAHRDGVQLIPPSLFPRSQFAGAIQEDVSIWCNHIRSRGALQCIFSADGMQRRLEVVGNVLETSSQWFIALRGLLDGRIEANEVPDGKPAPIWLGNTRLGGGTNVMILSFAGGFEYVPYQEIVDQYAWPVTTDLRGKIENQNYRHLANFDLLGFQQAAAELCVPEDVPLEQQAICHAGMMGGLACEFGDILS